MKKATFCCFTWIIDIELNFTVAFLLIRKTWDGRFAGKVRGMGDFKKWAEPSHGGDGLERGGWDLFTDYGSSCPEVFCKKVTLKSFPKIPYGNTCAGVFFKESCRTPVMLLIKRLRHMWLLWIFWNFQGKFFLQGLCKRPPLNVFYFKIFQKRKHFNSNNKSKFKRNSCTSE